MCHFTHQISSQFFVPDTRLSVLLGCIEAASPPLVFTAELCGFHYTPLVSLLCVCVCVFWEEIVYLVCVVPCKSLSVFMPGISVWYPLAMSVCGQHMYGDTIEH